MGRKVLLSFSILLLVFGFIDFTTLDGEGNLAIIHMLNAILFLIISNRMKQSNYWTWNFPIIFLIFLGVEIFRHIKYWFSPFAIIFLIYLFVYVIILLIALKEIISKKIKFDLVESYALPVASMAILFAFIGYIHAY